jgi:hypothetical protein
MKFSRKPQPTIKVNILKSGNDPGANTQAKIHKPANVFVIGDLVIDHTVFVKPAIGGHLEPVSGELAFQVQRRLDTAGGAATAARAISVSSEGTTFLWGLLGTSPWGTFRSILENSQALDGAMRSIELRGTQDETNAPMSTVSHLVLVKHTPATQERYERKARFVDSGKVHVPLSKLHDVMYHLQEAHRASRLDSIVLDDQDVGALTTELVDEISTYAHDARIPLIARLRRGAHRYDTLHAKAIVCTLTEWVHIVRSAHNDDYWKVNINKPLVADEFARLSLYSFPSVDYHIVLVGDDWVDSIVTIEKVFNNPLAFRVVTRGGPPAQEKGSHQVGTSDVFTGALAFALSEGTTSPSFTAALGRASQVMTEYQGSGWHRIPAVNSRQHESTTGSVVTEQPYGTKFLPRGDVIDVGRAKTCVPGILSVTTDMIEGLERLTRDLDNGWEETRSMILVASGGSGKTAIGDELIRVAQEQGYVAQWFPKTGTPWNWSNPAEILASVRRLTTAADKKTFIVVDEALKMRGAKAVASKGVVLLNDAKDSGVRFLFIDADFAKPKMDELQSQFGRRCTIHELPSAWQRARDIPYVMGECLRRGFADRPPNVSIEAAALVSVIEWMLKAKENFGALNTLCQNIVQNRGDGESLSVTWAELPTKVRGDTKPLHRWTPEYYRVAFD